MNAPNHVSLTKREHYYYAKEIERLWLDQTEYAGALMKVASMSPDLFPDFLEIIQAAEKLAHEFSTQFAAGEVSGFVDWARLLVVIQGTDKRALTSDLRTHKIDP